MKRSRALSIISKIIGGYVNPSSDYRISDRILKSLEEAGIKPPEILVEDPNPLIPGAIPMGNGKYGYPMAIWEPEEN